MGQERTSVVARSAILDDFADHLLAARALKDTLIVVWFIGLDAHQPHPRITLWTSWLRKHEARRIKTGEL
jgi:hypothetical protein